MFLTRISVGHPVFATMIMLAIAVLGYFSYQRTPVELFPNIDFPVVVVQTDYTGATPEAVESDITRPIENVVNTVSGLDKLGSRSYPGISVVIAQFNLDVDSATAAQDVRDKLATIEADLPDAAGKPQVMRFDPSAIPIMSVIVSSDGLPLRDLTTVADQLIVDRLTVVPGVGSATLVGGVKRQINIFADNDAMQSLGVGVNDIISALQNENRNIPAGSVTVGVSERDIEVEGVIEDPQEFRKLVVARRGGQPVYLWQVASIVDGQADETSRAIFNGAQSVAIDIVKIPGANTITVADGIDKTLDELRRELPSTITLNVVRDGSIPVRNSVDDVQTTLIEGGVLAVLIVFLFLNSWRSTVITGLTLPVSVIGTFSAVYFLGFTLNMLTLMALSLAIGILIDDAIVVRENITRHLHMGKSHRRAALEGTKEIGLAVLATSLSIVAVFLPVAFMGGIIGRFFLQFGVTIAVAVMISLFVSFTLDPMLSSVWYDPAAQPNAKRSIIGRTVGLFDKGFERIARLYTRLIRWALGHRLLTLAAVLVLFVGSVMMVPRIGAEFAPQQDQGEFQLDMSTPVGSATDYTIAKVRQVETVLHAVPEVQDVYTQVNGGQSRGTNRASIYVKLVPHEARERSANDVAVEVREKLTRIAGIKVSLSQPGIAGSEAPIQVNVLGDNIDTLKTISDDLADKLRAIRGTADVDTTLQERRPILGIRIDRDLASDLGVGMQQVAAALRPMLSGDTATSWTSPQGENYDVVVRLPEGQRADLAAVAALPLTVLGADGTPKTIRLDQIATITNSVGASEVLRQDMTRQVQVTANTTGRPIGEITQELQTVINGMHLPAGYRVNFGGDAEAMAESLGYAGSALIMAVLFIYFVLASQFGSFLQPLAIMVSLPLSLVGVLIGLLVTGSTLNMMSAIGFILLMGLVTKNAILLVDNANQHVREGMPLREALVLAGQTRFRPIIMTTLAMIFGMLPLALGLGEGGEFRAPMAHAVIGGLISSTLLTLVVVPVIVTYLDRLGHFLRNLFPKAPHDEDEADAPATDVVAIPPRTPPVAYPEAAE